MNTQKIIKQKTRKPIVRNPYEPNWFSEIISLGKVEKETQKAALIPTTFTVNLLEPEKTIYKRVGKLWFPKSVLTDERKIMNFVKEKIHLLTRERKV